jgi:hypothetical protein
MAYDFIVNYPNVLWYITLSNTSVILESVITVQLVEMTYEFIMNLPTILW